MAVENPGELLVTCDECGNEISLEAAEFAGNPPSFGVEDETLKEHGWVRDGNTTLCPECGEDLEE